MVEAFVVALAGLILTAPARRPVRRLDV